MISFTRPSSRLIFAVKSRQRERKVWERGYNRYTLAVTAKLYKKHYKEVLKWIKILEVDENSGFSFMGYTQGMEWCFLNLIIIVYIENLARDKKGKTNNLREHDVIHIPLHGLSLYYISTDNCCITLMCAALTLI